MDKNPSDIFLANRFKKFEILALGAGTLTAWINTSVIQCIIIIT
jgi:hypothetical protein